MSDQDDQNLIRLVAHVAMVFEALRTTCAHLPVPIALPGDLAEIDDIITAVCRVVELSDEQPMPELRQAQLGTASLHWIAAVDLTGVAANTEGDYRLLAAELNLRYAETAILDLGIWLALTE